jgi:hypothetical protein
MLNGAFAFNGGAALWANAPMPEHNSNAQRLMSACPPKQPLLSFLSSGHPLRGGCVSLKLVRSGQGGILIQFLRVRICSTTWLGS